MGAGEDFGRNGVAVHPLLGGGGGKAFFGTADGDDDDNDKGTSGGDDMDMEGGRGWMDGLMHGQLDGGRGWTGALEWRTLQSRFESYFGASSPSHAWTPSPPRLLACLPNGLLFNAGLNLQLLLERTHRTCGTMTLFCWCHGRRIMKEFERSRCLRAKPPAPLGY